MAATTLSEPHGAAVASLLALQCVQASGAELAMTGKTLKRLADTFPVTPTPAQAGGKAAPTVPTKEAA